MITLILPFRERLDLFRALMQTLLVTTRHPQNIEILAAVDDDDPVLTKETISFLEEYYKAFSFRAFIVKRSENFVTDYWNMLAKQARGRWIMAVNDDSEFKTSDWDYIIDSKMSTAAERIGDDILLGLVKDSVKRHGEDPLYPHFSCWCLQSKQAVDALGYFYDPKCWVWGPDHIAADLYRELSVQLGRRHCRLVSIMDVWIDHNSIHTERRPDDGFFTRAQRIDRDHPHGITKEHVRGEAQRLYDFIHRRNNEKQR